LVTAQVATTRLVADKRTLVLSVPWSFNVDGD
jgi:hypothetical protein